jgi:hypothetical protein
MKSASKLLFSIVAVIAAAIAMHATAASASPSREEPSDESLSCGLCDITANPNPCTACGPNAFCKQLVFGFPTGRCTPN